MPRIPVLGLALALLSAGVAEAAPSSAPPELPSASSSGALDHPDLRNPFAADATSRAAGESARRGDPDLRDPFDDDEPALRNPFIAQARRSPEIPGELKNPFAGRAATSSRPPRSELRDPFAAPARDRRAARARPAAPLEALGELKNPFRTRGDARPGASDLEADLKNPFARRDPPVRPRAASTAPPSPPRAPAVRRPAPVPLQRPRHAGPPAPPR
ncbi:MAG: hypothetical protein JNL82_04890 [Myxococcales bacterium]|nr:hypothetical protein [Myxococcales bacterium]